jgi:hypothetical protein
MFSAKHFRKLLVAGMILLATTCLHSQVSGTSVCPARSSIVGRWKATACFEITKTSDGEMSVSTLGSEEQLIMAIDANGSGHIEAPDQKESFTWSYDEADGTFRLA